MLTELRLNAFGVVDDSVLELGPGLTALTGETGAGKTMIVSGLGHLLGARADSGIVRRGAQRALVQGCWEIPDSLRATVEDAGATIEGSELISVRQITATGRSRAILGGTAVPVTTLAEVVGEMATIHGQSEQIRLATPSRQRELLDEYAQPKELTSYREAYRQRQDAASQLERLLSEAQERARETDMLRFGIDEIEAVAPVAGEDEALAQEQRRLVDLDELRTLAATAHEALSGSETDYDSVGALTLLGQARKLIEQLEARDSAAQGLGERAAELVSMLADLTADLARYNADLVADPLRLEAVGQRRSQLATLTRKYGNTIDEVLQWANNATQRLGSLQHSDDQIEVLQARVAELDTQLRSDAAKISQCRAEAATRFTQAVETELAALAMPNARLYFDVTATELGPHGADKVELLFAANPGSLPAPLGKVASGGELSRVRLALEVVLAAGSAGHTFVFDEVDAGVGGAVGLEIGRRLQRLATHSQVIVVTHLAQVAAFADTHFVVAKSDDGSVTTSNVHRLSDSERVSELARMMSGESLSTKGLAHARELLAKGRRR